MTTRYINNRYQLEDKLGVGGMGTVYRANHVYQKRTVALKIILGHLIDNPLVRERFMREVATAAALEHPHIVPVYDYGQAEGLHYVAMRYLSNGTLADRMQQGPFSLSSMVSIAQPIAQALYFAHQKGVVHRDVKPTNIIFDEGYHPILTDFGIVKVLNSEATELTRTGAVVGTPKYMAPEQWPPLL